MSVQKSIRAYSQAILLALTLSTYHGKIANKVMVSIQCHHLESVANIYVAVVKNIFQELKIRGMPEDKEAAHKAEVYSQIGKDLTTVRNSIRTAVCTMLFVRMKPELTRLYT